MFNYITLNQLTKTVKGLVNKINSELTIINNKLGNLLDLNTNTKTNMVAAINEIAATQTNYDDTVLSNRITTLENAGYITSYTETDPTVPSWAKAANKPSYTANEVGALPSNTSYVSSFNGESGAITYVPPVSSVNGQTGVVELNIPADTSDLTNGAGFLTSFTETDPTVPSWAKASTKPSYTYSEVGAAASSHAHGNITNAGDITVTAAIASGDRLVINDESASKIINSTITFGSSTSQFLANNGTWQDLNNSSLATRIAALENLEWATYYSGRSNPSNSQGQNGDIYLQY